MKKVISLYFTEKLQRRICNFMNNTEKTGEKKLKKFLEIILPTLLIIIISGITSFISDYFRSNYRLDSVESNLENIQTNIKELTEKIDTNFSQTNEQIVDINDKIIDINKDIGIHDGILKNLSSKSYENNTKIVKMLEGYAISTTFVYNEQFLVSPLWTSSNTVIAESLDGKEKYTSEELNETPLLVPYTENGNEVYFLGQYNNNNHWHGKCVLNVYDRNKLITILEAVYDDGNLISYKRISCEDGYSWVVTDRLNKGKYNSGVTWIYRKTKNHKKKFTMKDVVKKDIIYTDDLVKSLNEKLKSYYNGNSSKGYYNDNTGNAYLVKYDYKGNVEHLYVGKTKDGKEHDKTGNAWSISWNDTVKEYYYYKGSFSKGKRDYEPENWQPMTKKEINEIINPADFDCSLKRLIGNKKVK